MGRTKKKTYRVRYAPVDKEKWISKGYSRYDLCRCKIRVRAYSDVQALALANLKVPTHVISLYDFAQNGGVHSTVSVAYQVESIVEIIEREVQI